MLAFVRCQTHHSKESQAGNIELWICQAAEMLVTGRCKAPHTRPCASPVICRSRIVRCHGAKSDQQQQQQSLAAVESIRQLLTRRSYAPPRYIGPMEVSQIPGKRFGLTATRNLAVGELLLVTPPLAVAFGPAGEAPSNEELQQQLEGAQLEPWQADWLRALHRQPAIAPLPAPAPAAAAADAPGSADAVPSEQQLGSDPEQQLLAAGAATLADEASEAAEQELLPLLQRLLLHGPEAAQPASPPAQPAAAPSDVSIVSVTCPLSAEALQQVISENAYSEAAEDLGGALLRELDPEAVAGIWPEYSLLNHSCVPNTLAVCVGRYLLLHVTAAVLQGEELTCSYLGERSFSPVGVRRAFLQGVYGFHCSCERCIAEQRTFPTQYYPADDAVLGLSSTSSTGSSGSTSSTGVLSGLLSPFAGLLGGQQQQQQGGAKPTPSARHRLLQQQYEAVALELHPALQAAATADSRRQEQQLQLLAQVTDAVEALLEEVAAAVAGDAELAWQAAAANKWLLAAAYPLLQLQVELLELLLSSGGLPVDEAQLLLDEAASYGSGNSSGSAPSSSSRAMSAAGAAAAAKFALNPSSSRRRRQPKNMPGWLAGLWGALQGAAQQAPGSGGLLTKRQLLGLYAESLGRVVGVLDAVARGSEAHVVACIKHMDAVRQCVGPDSEEVAMAEGLCSRAHAARYGVQRGPEGPALLARLVSARRRQLLGASLARKMSVLAWEAATAR